MIRTTYDKAVDALAIELRARGKSARTVRVAGDIGIDFDAQGRAISVEILNASRHLTQATLDELPGSGEKLSLQEAGDRSGLSPSTLRGQIHKGRLKGEKRGRDWVVDATSLENYMESVESGERAPAPRTRKPVARKARARAR